MKRDTPWMAGNKNAQKSDTPLSAKLFIACTPEEKGLWVKSARDNGQKLAEWTRETLNKRVDTNQE